MPKPTLSRVKRLPWRELLQAATILFNRWWTLPEGDRTRLMRLLRRSRGRLGNLSATERDELGGLVRKLNLTSVGPELMALSRGGRRPKRR